MLHVLSKKSKSKKSHQRGQRPETSQDTRWDALEVETKSATPDYRNQRKFRSGKEASVLIVGEDRKFGGSIRTRSTSSRRSCSAMVTFESIKPTQVWQASASPSPPTTSATTRRCVKPKHPVDSLALSMIAQTSAENQWLSLSTGDEDDLSDSTDDDEGTEEVRKEGKGQTDSDRGKRASTSTSHRPRSSPSSSDSSSSFELSRSSTMSARHRRKKQSSRRHRRENSAFSSGTPSTSSDSSSSSSSSEEDNEFDLCWKMKAGGSLRNATAIQSTPQLKRAPHHHHHHHHHHQSLVLAPTGTPQVMPRYPSTHHYNRPQTLNLTAGSFPRPMSARSSSKDPPFVQTIARAVEDFFPTLEWIEKYKVISVHRGDLLRIIPYPGTNPDKTSPTTGWFLAQKWCADHGSGTSPIGFIPRIICSFVCPDNTPRLSHISPRHTRSHDYSMKMAENTAFMTVSADVSQATSGGQMSAKSTICDTFLESVSARSIYPSPQLSLHTPCTTAVKTSFTSIPAVYEIEDRDSGRGPSSGSEWSSGRGGSLSGATDINVDDKDQPQPQTQPQPQSQQQQPPTNKPSSCIKWSPTGSYQRRSSFDQQSGSNFSCPLPPPPMALLSHVCTVTMGEMKSLPTPVTTATATAFSVSDTEAGGSICSSLGTRTRLYVRGSKRLTSKATEGEVGMENNMEWRDEKGKGSPLTPAEPVDEEEEGDTSGSPQSTVVVVSSNSDPAHWEPYKTMIQVKFIAIYLIVTATDVSALHVFGEWSTDRVYTFVARFAFQKTAVDEVEATRGYIFGNVTSLDPLFNSSTRLPPATLVVVDGEYVTDLYGNASRPVQFFGDVSNKSHLSLWLAETARCRTMFSRINALAWHRKCGPKAKMDFLRQVPCTTGDVCSEEDDRSRVQPEAQFTFTVQDRRQPRFWYLSLIACYRNLTTCEWETSALPRPDSDLSNRDCGDPLRPCVPMRMRYDIWMVNGVPRLRDYYRFEHQFSFEYHDIFEIYLTFGVLYLFLGVILHIKYKGEYEPLACLLFTHIWLSFGAATLRAIHFSTFSFDGVGAPALLFIGDVVALSAESLLLILILTTAEVGFPILPAELSHFEQKVRQYQKRQCRRVLTAGVVPSSAPSFRESDSTAPNGGGRSRCKDIVLPPTAATWSVALCRSESAAAAAKMATMVPTPSVISLTYTTLGEEAEEASRLFSVCSGLCKCTQRSLRTSIYLGSMIALIISIELALYIWARFDQDPVLDISVWNTTPGRLLVAMRLVVVFWFLAILRRRRTSSNLSEVVEPLHFAAAYLLWLLALPIVVFVAHTSVSPLWRHKTIIGVMLLSDFLASILYAQLINRAK